MAKRLTDVDKWKKEWFFELKPHAKLAWLYLLDQCDHCGIWPRNFRLMSEQLGVKVDHAQLKEWFGRRVVLFDDDKYFIPSFFEFQYGSSKEGFRAKQSALATLQKLGLFDEAGKYKGSEQSGDSPGHLGNCPGLSIDTPSIGISTSTGKSNTKGGLGENNVTLESLELVYQAYPLKKGKTRGLEIARKEITSTELLEEFQRAVDNYRDETVRLKTDPRFIKHFATFMGEWRDWVDFIPVAQKQYQAERDIDHQAEVDNLWAQAQVAQ